MVRQLNQIIKIL